MQRTLRRRLIMRRIKNTEIAKFIFEEMKKEEKEYEVEYDKILQMVDDSITYNDDFEKDENGEIEKELTEDEITTLKTNMLDGVEEYYDSINEKF